MNISKELIDQCIAGEQLKQKELYLKLLPYLRAVSIRYLKNTDLISDALQDSFIDIFKSLKKYDPEKGEFHKWAVRITINATFKYNQRVNLGSQEEYVIELHDVLQQPEALKKISDDALLHIFKQMPDGVFEVFNLHEVDGYKHKEIGNILNISEANSRKKLSRARDWLKKVFKENSKNISGAILSQFL